MHKQTSIKHIRLKLATLADSYRGHCASKSNSVCERISDLSPQRYHIKQYPNLHYHVRLPDGLIIDTNYMQFFKCTEKDARVFVGYKDDFLAELTHCLETWPLSPNHGTFVMESHLKFPLAEQAKELYRRLWGLAEAV